MYLSTCFENKLRYTVVIVSWNYSEVKIQQFIAMINFNVGSGAKKLSQMGEFLTISSDMPQIAGFKGQSVGQSSWCWPARHPWHQLGCQEVVRERGRMPGWKGVALHDFAFLHNFSGIFRKFTLKINRVRWRKGRVFGLPSFDYLGVSGRAN